MTKEKLKQYCYIKKEIHLLQEEIQRLRATVLTPSRPDWFPRSNYAADRTANTVVKIVFLEEKLYERLAQLVSLREETLLLRSRLTSGC